MRSICSLHNVPSGLCTNLSISNADQWYIDVCAYTPSIIDVMDAVKQYANGAIQSQNLALWSSGFLIVNWAFGLGFVQRDPLLLSDKIFLYAIASVASFVIPPMVIFDWPRDRNTIYQITLVFSIWIWSVYQVIFM